MFVHDENQCFKSAIQQLHRKICQAFYDDKYRREKYELGRCSNGDLKIIRN